MKTKYLWLLMPLLIAGFSSYPSSGEPNNIGFNVKSAGTNTLTGLKTKDEYYQSIDTSKYGPELLGQIRDLTIKEHKQYTTWDDLGINQKYMLTDYDPVKPETNYIDFYTQRSDVGVPYNGNFTEREHVWCASLSNNVWNRQGTTEFPKADDKGGGADIHHIRPLFQAENGSRSNNVFTEYPTDKRIPRKTITDVEYGYTSLNAKAGYFEPYDYVKGDIARILMYLFIHYNTSENLGLNLPTPTGPVGDPSLTAGSFRMGSLPLPIILVANDTDTPTVQSSFQTLLKWHEMDKVDIYEMNRNEGAYSLQGNRNPFIDHPEWAEAAFLNEPINDANKQIRNLESIEIVSSDTVPYLSKFDNTNVTLYGHYDDGSKMVINGSEGLVLDNKVVTSQIGEYEINATYQGKTASKKVFVTNQGSQLSKDSVVKSEFGPEPLVSWSNNDQVITSNGNSWKLSVSDTGGITNAKLSTTGAKGAKIQYYKNAVISSQNNVGKIDKVSLSLNKNSKSNAVVSVKVGNVDFKCNGQNVVGIEYGSNNTIYDFVGPLTEGQVVITMKDTANKQSMYIASIGLSSQISAIKPGEQALSFANYFLSKTGEVCKGNDGSWEYFKAIVENHGWEKLASEYQAMSDKEKEQFATSNNETIKKALERYILIVRKYSNKGINNFANINLNASNTNVANENQGIGIAILSVAVISMSLIVVVYLVNRRKSKNK